MSDLHLQFFNDSMQKTGGSEEAKAAKFGGFLAAIAFIMGKVMDGQVKAIKEFAQSIGEKPTPAQTTELQMMTQQFSMFMSAVDNAIKTIGQANKQAAGRN